MDMAVYGLTGRHAAAAREYGENYAAGRILSQEKGVYRLICEGGEQLAEVSGSLSCRKEGKIQEYRENKPSFQ